MTNATLNPYPASWWHISEDGRIVCDLCPRFCYLKDGQRSFCFVRKNEAGKMVLTTYGLSTGFCIDPIEKKPLNHFYPGTSILSFGTAGCNLGCRFCQNWDISKAKEVEILSQVATPEAIAVTAEKMKCKSVAFTYNEPVIFAEYAIDTAKACHERGIKTVAVTAGYITKEARGPFFAEIDAANVDLKAFSEEFYKKFCFASLAPILETLVYLRNETNVWFEVTTLLIPGQNDSVEEIDKLCSWFVENLGEEVPLHFSAFHPDFKTTNIPPTPSSTLTRARNQALSHGLKHVYTGNVHDVEGQSTYCANCNALLIERNWYELGHWGLDNKGHCESCGHLCAGRFDGPKGTWGSKRLPIKIPKR